MHLLAVFPITNHQCMVMHHLKVMCGIYFNFCTDNIKCGAFLLPFNLMPE